MIRSRLSILALLLLPILVLPLSADLGGDVITFTHGVGQPTDMTGATEVIGANVDEGVAGTYPIGFTFNFGGGNLNYGPGTDYTDFSVSSNGWMTLGSTAPTDPMPTNRFDDATTYPMIAPFWDDMQTGRDGYVRYKTVGTAPNRMLVVEYRLRRAGAIDGGLYHFEIRLHEGSNIMTFFYISMASESTSASIAIAERRDNFHAVGPPFPPHTTEPFSYYTNSVSQGVNLSYSSIPTNTWYRFSPCVWDVSIAGHVTNGGTEAMGDGDTLMRGMFYGVDATLRTVPFRIYQKEPVCTLRCVEYELSGPYADEYEIRPVNTTTLDDFTCISPEDTLFFTVDFTPKGEGPRPAYLRISTDAGIEAFDRTYVLFAGSEMAPTESGNLELTAPTLDDLGCVGQEVVSKPLALKNSGTGSVTIAGLDAFRLAPDPMQGVPNRELLRDRDGNPIPTDEYFLTLDGPATGSASTMPPFTGLELAPDTERTIWVNFVAAGRDDRSARLYLRTDAPNLSATDVDGLVVPGLVSFDLHGKGSSPILAGVPEEGRPDHVQFGRVEVREPHVLTVPISNDGPCDLLISRREFRFVEGDITEFELLSILPSTPVVDGFYVLAPGTTDSVTIAFRPASYGSRRATIRLVTNDSTLGIPGIVAPGTYLWDFYGRGTFGIEVRDITMPPAVIGGPSSYGAVQLENTALENITVTDIRIEGDDDLLESDRAPWPNLPLVIAPGERVDLGVMLSPDRSAEPGVRQGRMVIGLDDGQQVDAEIVGPIGTRELMAGPTDLFAGTVVPVGSTLRRTLVLTNTGTMPVRIDGIGIDGPAADAYAHSSTGSAIIEPGSFRFIEVVLAPRVDGPQEALMTITGNATGGTITIPLTSSTSSTEPVTGEGTGRIESRGGGGVMSLE